MPAISSLPTTGLIPPEIQVGRDDTIFVAQNDVRSFSRTLGQLNWRFTAPSGVLAAGRQAPHLTLGTDTLFVASVGVVYALDLTSGALRWQRTIRTPSNGQLLAPLAFLPASDAGGFPDMVFLVEGETIFGLRAADGVIVWQVQAFLSLVPTADLIVTAVPGPVTPRVQNDTAGPTLPGGMVLVTNRAPVGVPTVVIEGLNPATGVIVSFPQTLAITGITMQPVITGRWLFLAGHEDTANAGNVQRIFGFSLDNFADRAMGQAPFLRFDVPVPAPPAGSIAPTFAVILGLGDDPDEPTFCWTTAGGELWVQTGGDTRRAVVPVSRLPPSPPVAYFNDNGEGRVFLVGNQPTGSLFGFGTLVALPIGNDPQLSFTQLNLAILTTPIRVNQRPFAATYVAASPAGGLLYAFDLNAL